jgi:prepilin peptidase CpaA
MANDLATAPAAAATLPNVPSTAPADDLTFDRELAMTLARVPLTAIAWAVAAYLAHLAWAAFVPPTAALPASANLGALVVICVGMVWAAWIDGYAFKVPNWLTLSLVVSGWYLGLMHSFGFSFAGSGGIGQALLGTVVGFAVLFPALFIGGMGEGDVKMTMAFGSWMGAFFGAEYIALPGAVISALAVIWWSFALGVIVGGIFGIVIMVLRRQIHKNLHNAREIVTDLQVMVTHGPKKAAERANSRRKDWTRLPYGVPLCVGFLGYLWFRLFLSA